MSKSNFSSLYYDISNRYLWIIVEKCRENMYVGGASIDIDR